MTLLELMLSMAILLIGMTAVVGLSSTVVGMTNWSSDISVGTNLGAAAIERLQVSDFNNYTGASNTVEYAYYSRVGDVVPETDAYFTVTKSITPEATLLWAEVETTIRWSNRKPGALKTAAECSLVNCKKVVLNARIYPQ